ncbi:hypothetical protein ACWDBO_47345 [Streptomyces mirabilis]|uniref:hypothetical protein n=2 Tax=Streptomyces mirabilis TaxID=68239 RepID=UPI00332F1B41
MESEEAAVETEEALSPPRDRGPVRHDPTGRPLVGTVLAEQNAVCTSLAPELGMSPWASGVEVVTIGFGEDLPQLRPTARSAGLAAPLYFRSGRSADILCVVMVADEFDARRKTSPRRRLVPCVT